MAGEDRAKLIPEMMKTESDRRNDRHFILER
jgi:hypothetical protein